MLPDELEATAARHVPGEGTIDIRRLGTGLVNESYRVVRAGRAYSLRVAAGNRRALGVDRDWEARVLENAVAADLAPAPVYCDPQRGILISRWVDGRAWDPLEVRRSPCISRMAEFVRRIHALPLPAPPRVMSPAKWIDYYCAEARQLTVAARSAAPCIAALRNRAKAQLAALAALPGVDPVMCHSDLHTLNLIDRGSSLVLLDWEYAHASDPLWDLAGWSANNDLEAELQQDLLAKYMARSPTPTEQLRLQRLGWLYDYVCLLWSELYLNLHGGAGQGAAAPDGVAARAQLLAARLHASK